MGEAVDYLADLINEYGYRFDKRHKLDFTWNDLWEQQGLFTKYPAKPFGNHTTNHKHIENVYDAYKKELQLKWKHDKVAPKWTNRPTPDFYKEEHES